MHDMMTWSLADLELLEETTGIPLGQLMTQLGSGNYSAKVLKGLAFVAGRQGDDTFTVDEAGDVTFGEALDLLRTPDTDNGEGSGKA